MSSYKRNLPEAREDSEYIQLYAFGSGLMEGPCSAQIDGLHGISKCNSWRNLIIHQPSGTKLWFDLGISDVSKPHIPGSSRSDIECTDIIQNLAQYPPYIQENQIRLFKAQPAKTNIGDNARSVGIDPESIDYIVARYGIS